jgi:hypothetical protein
MPILHLELERALSADRVHGTAEAGDRFRARHVGRRDGLMDGPDIAGVRRMGTTAAQMGTSFLLCH